MFPMYLRKCFTKSSFFINVRRFSANLEQDSINLKIDKRENKEFAELRDVSRLPNKIKGRMKHILEPHPHENKPDKITKLKRKKAFNNLLYASYGRKSGIDPSYFWMNEKELKEQKEFETEWEPSLKEKLILLKEKEEAEWAEIMKKDDLMVEQMKKMPGFIKEHKTRLHKETEKELEMQKKKQMLLDEAREYFGYNISPHDPRFEQMKLQKEEEEKKGKKLLKKKQKLE